MLVGGFFVRYFDNFGASFIAGLALLAAKLLEDDDDLSQTVGLLAPLSVLR
jgi:hypothetical protein